MIFEFCGLINKGNILSDSESLAFKISENKCLIKKNIKGFKRTSKLFRFSFIIYTKSPPLSIAKTLRTIRLYPSLIRNIQITDLDTVISLRLFRKD